MSFESEEGIYDHYSPQREDLNDSTREESSEDEIEEEDLELAPKVDKRSKTTSTKSQSQFIGKLYAMVQNPSFSTLINWSDGKTSSFSVYNPTEFSLSVLPLFFKHNNWQSFVRQLNMYGFHKIQMSETFGSIPAIATGQSAPVIAWEFQHPSFQQSRPDLLINIRRKPTKVDSKHPKSPKLKAEEKLELVPARPIIDIAPIAVTATPGMPAAMARSVPIANPPNFEGYGPSVGLPDYSNRLTAEGSRSREPSRAPSMNHNDRRESVTYPTSSNSQYLPRQTQQPMVSPRGAVYAPTPSSQPQYAPPKMNALETQMIKQVTGLDHQMKGLSAAFYGAQQDAVSGRASTYAVLKILLDLVTNLDRNGENSHAIGLATSIISELDPAIQYAPPVSVQNHPFGLSASYNQAPNQSQWSTGKMQQSQQQATHSQQQQLPQQGSQSAQWNGPRSGSSTESFNRNHSRSDGPTTTPTEELPQHNYQLYSSSQLYAPVTTQEQQWNQQSQQQSQQTSQTNSHPNHPTIYGMPPRTTQGFSSNGAYPSPRTSWAPENESRNCFIGTPTGSSLPPLSSMLDQDRRRSQEDELFEGRKKMRTE